MKTKTDRPNPSPSSIPLTDPRYPIWGRLFLCRRPRIAHYSTNYLETYGLHSSGSKGVDLEQAKKMETVYITINDMIELYNQNQMVAIVHQKDLKPVYEICQDYTFDYADKINRQIFSHNLPAADLIKIDEFAEAVYQYAGHLYGNEFAKTFLPEGLMNEVINLNKVFDAVDKKIKDNKTKIVDDYTRYDLHSPTEMMRKTENDKRSSDEDRPPLPERPTMRDLFKSYVGGGGASRFGED